MVLLTMCCSASVAMGLPPERHYEKISPSYKGGYGVAQLPAAAPDGESVAYTSLGTFEGAPANQIGYASGETYVAHRGPTGWQTVPFSLPAVLGPYNAPPISDFSSTFGLGLFLGQLGPNAGAGQFNKESEFFLHSTQASDGADEFASAGGILPARFINYVGASPELTHLIVDPPPTSPLSPEGSSVTVHGIYDVASDGTTPVRFVGLNNKGTPINPKCAVSLGASLTALEGKHSKYHAVAADGREIFFTTCAGSEASQQLFVRLDDSRTVEVSRTLEAGRFGGCIGQTAPHASGEVPCYGAAERPSAEFVGASEDGAKVLFTTKAPLGEDKDKGNDLYMAVIGCPSAEPGCAVGKREVTELRRISNASSGGAAEVQGVVGMSADASRIYFVAQGVLSGENTEHASPVAGADNMYLYEAGSEGATGTVTFISSLCSGSEKSGTVEDSRCPSDLSMLHDPIPLGIGNAFPRTVNDAQLWRSTAGGETEVELADNGRILVFSSYGRLTNDDTDDASDVYRYNAQTHGLERISTGEAGASENGNVNNQPSKSNPGVIEQTADADILPTVGPSGSVAVQNRLGLRSVNEDGSRILFFTPEALSGKAINGLMDAYEWHEGGVSLLSTGVDPEPMLPGFITMSASGNDIFFVTGTQLLRQDTDEAPDLYDARLGPGFPPSPSIREECAGEECQGPLTDPEPVLVPASTLQSPETAIGQSKQAGKSSKAHRRVQSVHKRKKRRARRGRRQRLTRKHKARSKRK
ncbi:MAG: hypothetical protein ACTHM1_11520 [Solirubrobacteraceae bacterium]